MQNTRTAAAAVNDACTLMHKSSFCPGEPRKECFSKIGIPGKLVCLWPHSYELLATQSSFVLGSLGRSVPLKLE